MSKSREWWINIGDYSPDDYFECFVSARDPQKLSDDDDYMNIKNLTAEIVHVIEKFAYDALAAENKRHSDMCIEMANDRLEKEWPIFKENEELRAENEKLNNELAESRAFERRETSRKIKAWSDIEQLRAANAELVEALRLFKDYCDCNWDEFGPTPMDLANKALAKHGGEK